MQIRVLIVPDGHAYHAQGVNVNFSAQGETAHDAKNNFITGLRETIKKRNLFQAAPTALLNPLMADSSVERWVCTLDDLD